MSGRISLAECRAKARSQKTQQKTETVLFDPYEKVSKSKFVVSGQTGLGDNPLSMLHYCLWDVDHQESPRRYEEIMKRLTDLKLVDRCLLFKDSEEITPDKLLSVHSPELHNRLKNAVAKHDDEKEEFCSMFDAVYINVFTPAVAAKAAQTCIDLVDKIIKREIQNGIAVIRPPGHHAGKDHHNGYCIYNNACLAAEHALKQNITKILIVDWDVHHGQGIQNHFYNSSNVLYISIHRYEHGTFWPNLEESNYNYIGSDHGKGFNINVPLNSTAMTDADYLYIFHNIIMPVAVEFQPELVIVSAGYDAALGCPEGEMCLSPAVYYLFTHYLMSLASGRVAILLEGGYCIQSLVESVVWTLHALLKDCAPSIPPIGTPSHCIKKTTFEVYKHLSKYWKCFDILQNSYDDIIVPKLITEPYMFGKGKFTTRETSPKQPESYKIKCKQLLSDLEIKTEHRNPSEKVVIIYDLDMIKHKCEKPHLECPERITESMKLIKDFGLDKRVAIIRGSKAEFAQLSAVHDIDYLNDIEQIMKGNKKSYFDSIYVGDGTFSAAEVAAGSAIKAVNMVMDNLTKHAFALIRPPGHHAEIKSAGGFCFYNNVAIAVRYAINQRRLKRILIFDFDIHHGNGTQEIFYSTDEVLYISIHRHENGKFYPNKETAGHQHTGVDKGKGYSINIPWDTHGMSDGDYAAAVHRIVLPIAYAYNPEVVFISAGFDAAIGDPLGKCKVTPEFFAHMIHYLMPLANGKIILFLEGGYNLTSVSHCVVACIKTLLGDPLPMLVSGMGASTSAKNSIQNVITVHHKQWPLCCFDEFETSKVAQAKAKTIE